MLCKAIDRNKTPRNKASNLSKTVFVCVVVVIIFATSTVSLNNDVLAKTQTNSQHNKPRQSNQQGKGKVNSSEINAQIIATANYYHLDPNLLTALVHQESGFNTQATSNKGAMGLMQMIPSTAKRFGVTNAYDPNQSLHGGSRYLVWLLRRYNGRLDLALAGYNAGEGAVEKYGNRVPPYKETQNYVRSITLNYLSKLKNQKNQNQHFFQAQAQVQAQVQVQSHVQSQLQTSLRNKQQQYKQQQYKQQQYKQYVAYKGYKSFSKRELKTLLNLDSLLAGQ